MKALVVVGIVAAVVGTFGVIATSFGATGASAGTSTSARTNPSTSTSTIAIGRTSTSSSTGRRPIHIWASTMDVRGLAGDGASVWAATGGGIERYAIPSGRREAFGTLDGLDTLDTRLVRLEGETLVVETATARCVARERTKISFQCEARAPRGVGLPEKESFEGYPVAAKVTVAGKTVIGTRGGGVFVAADKGEAVRLSIDARAPASFVHAAARHEGALWLGTFRDGLIRVRLEADGGLPQDFARAAEPVTTPFKMVNELVSVEGALFVAANEGLFVTRDGYRFEPVPAIGGRGITGVAADARALWITSTGALYTMDRSGRGKVRSANLAPAGSKSIQGVVPDGSGGAWLATEDRGLVRFDGKRFVSMDRLSGFPTSWIVSVAPDGRGGAIAATLRDGFVHVRADGTWAALEHGASAAGRWGLTAVRTGDQLCLGAQEGASCANDSAVERLAALPDPRVHLLEPVGPRLLVATESGLAVY